MVDGNTSLGESTLRGSGYDWGVTIFLVVGVGMAGTGDTFVGGGGVLVGVMVVAVLVGVIVVASAADIVIGCLLSSTRAEDPPND